MSRKPIAIAQPAPSASPTQHPPSASPAQQLTQFQIVWLRLRRRRAAFFGLLLLLLIAAMAVLAPIITPENPYDLTTWDATNASLSPRLSPAWYFVLGTDPNGHLMLSQIAWGARVSLSVGVAGTLIAVLAGVLVGTLAGYYGGWIDSLLMRVTDVFLILPFLPLIVLAVHLFDAHDVYSLTLVFAVFSWPTIARITRVLFVGLRERDYAESARALGVGTWRIMVRHLLPNATGPITATATVSIATCITTEAVVDFFREGVRYPDVSWGTILFNARAALGTDTWWWAFFPGAALTLTVLAVNLAGHGLDEAFDERI